MKAEEAIACMEKQFKKGLVSQEAEALLVLLQDKTERVRLCGS